MWRGSGIYRRFRVWLRPAGAEPPALRGKCANATPINLGRHFHADNPPGVFLR